MDEQKLNKKLAEWAGYFDITDGGTFLTGKHKVWSNERSVIPNFTESLDACFKWLVPKLNGCHIDYLLDSKWCYFATAWIKGRATQCVYEDNPALALCLAIEKLIDGGKV